ncbi:short-chain fatty acid transporter [Propionivibrio dicarboxylicus]|uniref:Short-chain fatty acids transporter n=1 Tax=Propionivibrio dicarboxylicus TaxID=83767 RepID=A0A1G8NBM7_9RHOO|nr:TIGR00366 family protein [Propionivibrio dicarboxylicus]SDI76930.1 short-chain fatty acids transporter [Propionivibrio dicarboxylicus]
MSQENRPIQEEEGAMQRMGASLANWAEKWFPDAYVFAAIAVLVVVIAALAMGRTPAQVSVDFGKSFWNLIPFTMQMAFVVIGGYIVAVSPPVRKIIMWLAQFPKTPKVAVAYVAFVAMIASLLSWGFSLIFAGILMREVSKRVAGVDYRAMGAAGYLGLGSIWALGLSSSAALLMATKGSIPPALLKISGVIALADTLFTWQNLVMIVVLLILSVWICYASTPTADKAKTVEMAGITYKEENEDIGTPQTPGEKLEFSPVLTLVIVALGLVYLYDVFSTKGGLAALDLNTYNFMFLIAGMLLHWTPRSFLRAAAKSVPMTGGVLLQFPLYAGIFGVLMGSGLNEVLAHFFVSISTKETLPLVGGIYSAILGLFLPSGGGKWVVEAPYLLQAANELHVNLAWMVQVYNAAEALPNFINPFWMLPLMGLTGVKARDLAGYSTLQLIFHTPVVLLLLWALGLTLPYVPPVLG